MFSEDVGGDGIGLQHCIPLVIFKLSNFNGLALFLTAPCSAMAYHHDSRRIFVGQDNGAIMVSCLTFFSMWIRIAQIVREYQALLAADNFSFLSFWNAVITIWLDSLTVHLSCILEDCKEGFTCLDVSQLDSRNHCGISVAMSLDCYALQLIISRSILSWMKCPAGTLTGIVMQLAYICSEVLISQYLGVCVSL